MPGGRRLLSTVSVQEPTGREQHRDSRDRAPISMRRGGRGAPAVGAATATVRRR